MEKKTFTAKQWSEARQVVSQWWAENSKKIRLEDAYASHVTQEQKDEILKKSIVFSEEIAAGLHDHNFTIWQRMYYHLTGESVALLPKS